MAKAVCVLRGDNIDGFVHLTQVSEEAPTIIEGNISGLSKGKHGFSVNIYGDLSCGISSVGIYLLLLGGHFNPFGKQHGAPEDEDRHVGSLGNIEVNAEGIAQIHIEDKLVKLIGPYSIIGRSLVVYANEDDLGKGGQDLSLVNGNAGNGIAAGVVGIANNMQ